MNYINKSLFATLVAVTMPMKTIAYNVILPWCGRIQGGHEADMFGYRMRFNGSWFQPADEVSYAVPGPHSVDRLIIKVPCEPNETRVAFAGSGFERIKDGRWVQRNNLETRGDVEAWVAEQAVASQDDRQNWTPELPPIPEKPFPGLRVVVGPNTYFLEDDLKTWLVVGGGQGELPSNFSILEDREKGVFVFAGADGRTQADLYKPGHPYMRMATCPSYEVAVREAWRMILPPAKSAPKYNFTPVTKP